MRELHVITPGDHFSPSTGSAIPTVVNGVCSAVLPGGERPAVLVARGTWGDRYGSADVIEYEPDYRRLPAQRYVDVLAGRAGLRRPGAGRAWKATVAAQAGWPESFVIGHNGPQLARYVDTERHRAVLYAHNSVIHTYSRREAQAALGSVHRIICVSNALAEQVSANLPPGIRSRIRVVRNGVDCEQFRPIDRPERPGLRVAFIGRTIPDKAPDVLLEAHALLGRDDISVTIIGSHGFDPDAPLTDYEQSLRVIAARSRGPVEFVATVPRPDVPKLLASADVLVVPSAWPEPCPLTINEGMASGLAVIGSDVGGIPEELGDAGILVRPRDARALADALAGLADDIVARTRLKCAARARAEAHDWRWTRSELDRALEA